MDNAGLGQVPQASAAQLNAPGPAPPQSSFQPASLAPAYYSTPLLAAVSSAGVSLALPPQFTSQPHHQQQLQLQQQQLQQQQELAQQQQYQQLAGGVAPHSAPLLLQQQLLAQQQQQQFQQQLPGAYTSAPFMLPAGSQPAGLPQAAYPPDYAAAAVAAQQQLHLAAISQSLLAPQQLAHLPQFSQPAPAAMLPQQLLSAGLSASLAVPGAVPLPLSAAGLPLSAAVLQDAAVPPMANPPMQMVQPQLPGALPPFGHPLPVGYAGPPGALPGQLYGQNLVAHQLAAAQAAALNPYAAAAGVVPPVVQPTFSFPQLNPYGTPAMLPGSVLPIIPVTAASVIQSVLQPQLLPGAVMPGALPGSAMMPAVPQVLPGASVMPGVSPGAAFPGAIPGAAMPGASVMPGAPLIPGTVPASGGMLHPGVSVPGSAYPYGPVPGAAGSIAPQVLVPGMPAMSYGTVASMPVPAQVPSQPPPGLQHASYPLGPGAVSLAVPTLPVAVPSMPLPVPGAVPRHPSQQSDGPTSPRTEYDSQPPTPTESLPGSQPTSRWNTGASMNNQRFSRRSMDAANSPHGSLSQADGGLHAPLYFSSSGLPSGTGFPSGGAVSAAAAYSMAAAVNPMQAAYQLQGLAMPSQSAHISGSAAQLQVAAALQAQAAQAALPMAAVGPGGAAVPMMPLAGGGAVPVVPLSGVLPGSGVPSGSHAAMLSSPFGGPLSQPMRMLSQSSYVSGMSTVSNTPRTVKAKVICSAGGQFVKNEAGKLVWQGGETRLLTLAQTTLHEEVVAALGRLSERNASGASYSAPSFKYQLPSDPSVYLDLVDDDDVCMMFDEWHEAGGPANKLHIFVSWPQHSGGECYSDSDKDPPTIGSLLEHNSRDLEPSARLTHAAGDTSTTTTGWDNSPRKTVEELAERMEIIPARDITLVKFLGAGGFGEVYLGRWHSSECAVKCLNPSLFFSGGDGMSVSRSAFAELVKEADLLGSLRHPNVVWVYGMVLPPVATEADGSEDGMEHADSGEAVEVAANLASTAPVSGLGTLRPPAIVTEYMGGGSLRGALSRKADTVKGTLSRLIIALDAAKGLEYLHGKNIVHFDLKSANLLLGYRDKRVVCKVSDFGLSKQKFQTYVSGVTSSRGTLPWIAPEIIRSPDAVNEKVDVYSFGIVLWELWTGVEPYEGLNYHALLHQMTTNKHATRPPLPGQSDWEASYPEEPAPGYRTLVEHCWAEDPEDRPNFEEIVEKVKKLAAAVRPPKRALSTAASNNPAQRSTPRVDSATSLAAAVRASPPVSETTEIAVAADGEPKPSLPTLAEPEPPVAAPATPPAVPEAVPETVPLASQEASAAQPA